MARLIITETNDRTICVIKNFITIELFENLLRIIDQSGLTEVNIFDLKIGRSISWKDKYYIYSSNCYYKSSRNDYWQLHFSTFDKFSEVLKNYVEKQLLLAISNRVLKLKDVEVSYDEDNFIFKTKKFSIKDSFEMMSNDGLVNHKQSVFIGENSVLNVYFGNLYQAEFKIPKPTNSITHLNIYTILVTPSAYEKLKTFIKHVTKL